MMNRKYDLIVIGSGPGGYVAAIRAAKLNMKVAVIEKAELGGICLNWGCIPTKALLKSAQIYKYTSHLQDYGLQLNANVSIDFEAVIRRSRNVAETMSKGIQFLFKKNNIEVIQGTAKLLKNRKIEVTTLENTTFLLEANHIILATGARSKQLPHILQDGERIIGYREALVLPKLPETMLVIGSGAIGSEFAYFYATMGTKVSLVEFLPNILPNEDEESSKQIERSFKKAGIRVFTSTAVESVEIHDNKCKVTMKDAKEKIIETECDIVLSAVGITPNLENLGIEECGIALENGKIKVDDYYRTNCDGIYAIGDIVHGPALAHVASHEALICVEKIAGLTPHPLDYWNIPSCTYTSPEVASVGLKEETLKAVGREYLVGKFPFTASGKATASGNRDGMVKLLFDKQSGQCLGCHLVGENVTEMIFGVVSARRHHLTGHDFIHTVFPHPTLSEAIMEAAAAAYGEEIHL
jgi:dihydrolipoamide dehydrogenase